MFLIFLVFDFGALYVLYREEFMQIYNLQTLSFNTYLVPKIHYSQELEVEIQDVLRALLENLVKYQ
jgi:hypothetical protein